MRAGIASSLASKRWSVPGSAPERHAVDEHRAIRALPRLDQPARLLLAGDDLDALRDAACAAARRPRRRPRRRRGSALPTPITIVRLTVAPPRGRGSASRTRCTGRSCGSSARRARRSASSLEASVARDDVAQVVLDRELVLRGRRDDLRVEDRALGVDPVAVVEQPARRLAHAVAGARDGLDRHGRRGPAARRPRSAEAPRRRRRRARRCARRCCGTASRHSAPRPASRRRLARERRELLRGRGE